MPYETPAELAALIVETMARVDTVMDEVELLRVKGSVASVGALPAGASAGDAYVVETGPSAGHLFGWVTTAWIDFGKFQGEQGVQGQKGWSPILQVVADGARRVLRITDWDGGAGAKPATGGYLGPSGIVVDIAAAADVRGSQGVQGQKGWAPVIEVVADGARRVLRVADWSGGEGTKPASGQYLGAAGLVTDVADAADVRGAIGATGPAAWAAPVAWTTLTAFTASAPRSVVTQGGRSYACLVSHTSGTFSSDLADGHWIMVADKGTDGTGTGTVQHAGSPAAGQLARFADASGDLLEGVAATKSLVGLSNVDNTADLAKPISTAVQAALDLKMNIADAATQTDILRNLARAFMYLAELRAARLGTPNGWADDFSTSAGVDAAASTGEVYDAAGKRYTNATATAANLSTASSGGNVASATTEFGPGYEAWRAFDGVLTGDINARWRSAGSPTYPQDLIREWPIAQAWTTYTVKVSGEATVTPNGWTIDGWTGSSWVTLDSRVSVPAWSSSEERAYAIASPGPYTKYRMRISGAHSGAASSVAELTYASTPALDLRSVAGVSAGIPTRAHLIAMVALPPGAALNADLKGYVTRNGGGNWTQVTFVQAETVGAYAIVEALNVDLSAQPVGSSLRWRLEGGPGWLWDFSAVTLLCN